MKTVTCSNFKCFRCYQSFIHKRTLIRHMSESHMEGYRFSCPHCHYGFTRAYRRDQHQRSCRITREAQGLPVAPMVTKPSTNTKTNSSRPQTLPKAEDFFQAQPRRRTTRALPMQNELEMEIPASSMMDAIPHASSHTPQHSLWGPSNVNPPQSPYYGWFAPPWAGMNRAEQMYGQFPPRTTSSIPSTTTLSTLQAVPS